MTLLFRNKQRCGATGNGRRSVLSGVSLVDRCLLVFMGVLLLQSAWRIFCPEAGSGLAGDIDIIIRTSSAAIFGYFLSANFLCQAPEGDESGGVQSTAAPTRTTGGPAEERPVDRLRGQIGFAAGPESEAQPGTGSVQPAQGGGTRRICAHLQVLAAAGIGLFCLLTLILACDVAHWDEMGVSASVTATIAQFRDFVSGCVGFLIGSPAAGSGSRGT